MSIWILIGAIILVASIFIIKGDRKIASLESEKELSLSTILVLRLALMKKEKVTTEEMAEVIKEARHIALNGGAKIPMINIWKI